MIYQHVQVYVLCLDEEGFFLETDRGFLEEKDFNVFMKKFENLLRERWELTEELTEEKLTEKKLMEQLLVVKEKKKEDGAY